MNAGSTHVGANAVAVKGWLKAHRFLIARRTSQAGILGLFLLGPLAGQWIVKGNLNSSLTLGVLPLTDPYVLLQSLAVRHWPETTAMMGAIIVAVFYALVGGRAYCSWVCPVNLVTDAAAWLRRRLGLHGVSRLPRATRQGLLLVTFAVSAVVGVVAWEFVNPVSMFHRGLIFGVGLAWVVILAVFLLDAFVSPRSWCGNLCPVGAFYGHLGHKSLVRVRADERARCDDCGDCYDVCPEPQVIPPALKGAGKGVGPVILDVACTNCGRCIDVCSMEVFVFGTRLRNEVPRINQPRELMEIAPMKKSMTITLVVLLATISTALFSPLSGAETAGVQTLRAADVAVPDQPPEEQAQLGAKPGAQKLIALTFEQQPPLISHTTVNFDEITLEENQCLSCHDLANYERKEATKIGEKHFIDSDGKVQEAVLGSHYVCSLCHVSQTNASPLVENTFRSVPVKAAEAQ